MANVDISKHQWELSLSNFPMQCAGITTKGVRCKLRTTETYCKHHIYQGKPHQQPPQQKGLIYVFTLSHLLLEKPPKTNWLRINKGGYDIKQTSSYDVFNPRRCLLIKVGFTTQTIPTRLKQWSSKCRQDFKLLLPNTKHIVISRRDRLSDLFSGLSLEPVYHRYDPAEYGFVCSKNVISVESAIHKYLHSKYGKGNLYCQGCSNDVKIHTEWFLIPRKEMNNVFKDIDRICNELG
ncbi:unnamed protein product [Kuraishia capsulata CBS 1993]|uniref:Bacteriophage T5 Orf172 DNA-binding domain-containing protein n=1 Tax=Kuraishia capsulata CBS 1993 TaxID=1382522 RepID=W6MUD1_9ASCO|nr:uncharacterized protein KUCA_T00001520001 [Kuraishia capsulata CBS 1993]CDK25550.1 unnamed protein product [Kuraishia capsulata CBS 1993]